MPLFGRGKKIEKPDVDDMLQKRDVDGLCKALSYKDEHVQKAAADALGEIGDTRAVDSLIKTLQDARFITKFAHYELQCAAVEALGEIGDAQAVGPLIKTLQNACCKTRGFYRVELQCAVAEALGKISDVRAVGPLVQALQDERFEKRAAAEALGEIGDVRAVDPLIKALQDDSLIVQRAAAEALGKIGDIQSTEALRLYFSTRTLVEKKGFAPIHLKEVPDSPKASAKLRVWFDSSGKIEISNRNVDALYGEESARAVAEEKEVHKQPELAGAQKFICSECGEEIPHAIRCEPPDLTMRCSGIARQCSCGWTCCFRCDPTYNQPENGHKCPRCGKFRSGWVRWDPHRNLVDRSGWIQIDGEPDYWFKGGLWKRWKEDRESDRWTTIQRALAKRLDL